MSEHPAPAAALPSPAAPLRLAVIGPGAIGITVAATLAAESPHDVVVCARRPLPPLELHRPDHQVVRADPPVLLDPTAARAVDVVLLATKAYQSEGAAGWLAALSGPGTVVAVLQNGIDQIARVAPLVPEADVVPAVVMLAADVVAPGVVHQAGAGVLELPDNAAGRRVAGCFTGTGLGVELPTDFTTRAWRKLLINTVVGSMGALTLRDLSVLAEPAIADAAMALAAEVVAVGRAEGAELDLDAAARAIDRARRGAAGHWSSIAADRREGRPLEWEVRNAVIGRLGRRHGIATPLNDLVTALLAACDPR